ncbi:MAG: sulfatase-like hydrolase/transferase [Ketobacteraceae bacterium]|nr:sulfatase-like hydrolase/transferase [Ketobacteraceae bacterium]
MTGGVALFQSHTLAKDLATNDSQPLFRKADRYLIGCLFFPLLGYLMFTKWAVVSQLGTTPLEGLNLAEFLRMHIFYYLMAFCWAAFLVMDSDKWHKTFRAVAIVTVLFFSASDLAYSASIQLTGVLAPFDVAYYAALALGTGVASIPVAIAATMVFIPLAFLLLPFLKYRSLGTRVAGNQRKRIGLAVTGVLSMFLACAGPTTFEGELSHIQPSYLYQLDKFQEKLDISWHKKALADEVIPRKSIAVGESGSRPNLVMIGLESVRAMAAGVYNEQRRAVTPYLNELSENSLVFDRAYTVVPHTSKALAAVNCGVDPFFRHPIFESHLGMPQDCLADILRRSGYRTVFFQSPTEYFENRRGLVNQFGFEDFFAAEQMPSEGFDLVNYFGYEDNVMLEPSKQWLQKQKEPFFAFYLTGTTHHPYWTPERYGIRDFSNGEAIPDEENQYLNALYYLDHFIADLIAQYKALGLYENTVFVLFGDHGESIQSHGRHQHNVSMYEETLRIPLIIHGPGIRADRVTAPVVTQTDIMPTVLSLMGFQVPQSLSKQVVTGQQRQERAVFAACWYDDWCVARVDQQFKYIYNFSEKPEELYDLRQDPDEKTNLASRHPEKVAAFREQALAFYRRNLEQYHQYYSGLEPDYWGMKAATVSKKMRMLRRSEEDAGSQPAVLARSNMQTE